MDISFAFILSASCLFWLDISARRFAIGIFVSLFTFHLHGLKGSGISRCS